MKNNTFLYFKLFQLLFFLKIKICLDNWHADAVVQPLLLAFSKCWQESVNIFFTNSIEQNS